ncbi:MAG: hypothetical protein HKN25_03440 [Pyrinomonadaceae bacterium]|nr:hypothetical protein [Pyrinomonadaceae bacterium]
MEPEAMEQRWIMLEKGGVTADVIEAQKDLYKKEGLDGMRRHNLKNRLAGIKTKLEEDKNAYIKYNALAYAYADLKDKEKTLEYLNKAYQQREVLLVNLKNQRQFDFLNNEPEFQELLKKIGFPE